MYNEKDYSRSVKNLKTVQRKKKKLYLIALKPEMRLLTRILPNCMER